MPGVAAPHWSSTFSPSVQRGPASGGGPLSYVRASNDAALRSDYVYERNCGWRRRDLEEWCEKRAERRRLSEDTERFADVLAAQGVVSRQPGTVAAVGLVTGCVDELDTYRNINFLPLVASRNRAPTLREVKRWLQLNPQAGRYVRYGVITTGERVPLFGNLRGRLQGLHRMVSRWAHEIRHTYGIEVLHRQSEVTIDAALSLHPHANILYWPTRPLGKEVWADFLRFTHEFFGAHWKDNGRMENLHELIKYIMKGDDVGLLADAACVVPNWADRDAYAALPEVARRIRNDLGVKAPAHMYEHQAMQYLDELGDVLTAQAERFPHPLVWLEQQLHRLHLGQSYGPLQEWRKGLRERGEKVVVMRHGDGGRLVEVKRTPRPERDDRERPPRADENQVLGVTLPQPRYTPWAEPVALVANWTRTPESGDGRRSLQVLADLHDHACGRWEKGGAPAPAVAIQRTRMVASALDVADLPSSFDWQSVSAYAGIGAGGGEAAERPASGALYRPHNYENCPSGTDLFDPREAFADLDRQSDGEAWAAASSGGPLSPAQMDELAAEILPLAREAVAVSGQRASVVGEAMVNRSAWRLAREWVQNPGSSKNFLLGKMGFGSCEWPTGCADSGAQDEGFFEKWQE